VTENQRKKRTKKETHNDLLTHDASTRR